MSDWAVLVTRRLASPALSRLAARCDITLHEGPGPIPRDRLLRDIHGKHAAITLVTDRVDDELLDAAGDRLVIVSNFGVGFDNIDVAACSRRGVLVTNTPDVLTEATADIAWVLIMAAARRVGEGERLIRSRTRWNVEPGFMLGQDVYGKVLGVVGFGRIGQAMAKRAQGFGMRVIYHSSTRRPEEVERALGAEYRDLDALLEEADFVTLHTSLTPETRHLIDAERLARMKPTAVLVNASRGPVIDEAALAEALQNGVIFAAGLDVFEREPEVHPGLLGSENVVLVPHLGSATVETRLKMAQLACESVVTALEGRRPATLVDPDVWGRRRPVDG